MGKLTSNRCPHCGGNIEIYYDLDLRRWYAVCILCARESEIDDKQEGREK